MKKFSFLVIITAFLIQGCFSENSVSPEFDQSKSISKTWLESSDILSLEKDVIVAKEIDGLNGGSIDYDLKVGNIRVYGTLNVPVNSFEGTLNISALFSNRNTTQTFGPSPLDFNESLVLDLEYSGVNLKNVDPNEVDFYYIGSDGNFQRAEYQSIEVDPAKGILKVAGAKINHFSRYGWAK